MPETEKPPVDRYSPPLNKFKAPDGKTYTITPKEKIFCDVYLEPRGNQTVAALEAYEIRNKHLCEIDWSKLSTKDKIKRQGAESTAATIGSKKIRKPTIKAYIDTVLTNAGWVEKEVRIKHFDNVTQEKSVSASNKAIDMYYKLKGKYPKEKLEIGVDERMEKFLDKWDKRLK